MREAEGHDKPTNQELHLVPANEPIHLIVDSTGLSIVGEGEWAAAKHGGKGKRGWKKLHLGVNRSGVIVAQALTDGSAVLVKRVSRVAAPLRDKTIP